MDSLYRGRFAPTPSGPLHLGSLLTALASWLQARRAGGAWLLRIDDLDRARCPPGTAARILRQLEAHDLTWAESPRYQRDCIDEYRAAFASLRERGVLYRCRCTRAVLHDSARAGPDGPVYPGTCRHRVESRGSVRLRVAAGPLCFDDGWQGRQCRDLEGEIGDFVVQRADGVFGYQLACAVDERAQRITEVVRGADLLGSTFQQRVVQQQLGFEPPGYRHLPIVTDARGRKLSKQNHAAAVDGRSAPANLLRCLQLLGQQPPSALRGERSPAILAWAASHWDAAKVPRTAQIQEGFPYNAVQQTAAPSS